MKKNKIYLVLDASGSMDWLRRQAIDLLNGVLKTAKKENEKNKQRTEVTVITFDYPTNIQLIRKNKNIKTVKPVEWEEYRPTGSTALFDAVATAINDGLNSDDSDDPDTSFLVIAVTDGHENSSEEYPKSNTSKLTKLIDKAQKTRRWTITFQVPHGSKHVLTNLGILNDNIREWETTVAGIREAEVRTSSSLSRYYGERSRGISGMANFYVETDLSNLTPRTLKRELTDLSDYYGIFTTPDDVEIRDFVEKKTKRTYTKGQAFYQLVKSEVVQANKEVLIFDKGKTTIYGGDEARDLIGLPINQNAKVKPGDHANYEIFVQSTSVNRKLPKGSKVAVKVT